MKYFLIFYFFTIYGFGQSILGELHYNNSKPRTYISKALNERKAILNNIEERYYENRRFCNELEAAILNDLKSLRIDSINKFYRDGLNRNLERIRGLKDEGEYEDYSVILMDITDDLISNQKYYKDEEEYEKNIFAEQLKQKEEENRKLREELENQKKINKKIKD